MRKRARRRLAALLTAVAIGHGAAAAAAASTKADVALTRRAFIAAMQRVRLLQTDLPDAPALKAYVIYDYLVATRLRRDLTSKPSDDLDRAIDDFLHAHAGEPVARPLLRAWLASLASRGRWDWFLPRAADATDPELICDRLAGRLALGETEGLAQAALARWILPQRQPSPCDPVFTWLRAAGLLTAELAENRTRSALLAGNAGLAREFATDVPEDRAAPLLQWADLLESPKQVLERLAADPALPVLPEALAAGYERLSRVDSIAGAALLPKLLARPLMPSALQAQLMRSAALGAAFDRDPGAIAAFDRLPMEAIDGTVYEWRVRAALWAGDYAKALAWIAQLPPNLADLPRWQYWRARAVEATAGADLADSLYAKIAGSRDYYGYLAADRLHERYDLNAKPSPDDRVVQKSLAAIPGLIRARELIACDLADEAQLEWATAMRGAAPALQVQAAHLAADWGWYAESIAALAQAGEWDDVRLRYPRPFHAAVARAHELTSLPADWILAVMRQESLFRKDAVSRADARGLMQLLPSTAAAVARRWHFTPLGEDSLFDPRVAVPLGAAHLRELLDRYDGQLEISLAAYNAGSTAVARWLPAQAMDPDIWIESIPYGETRGYVQHILEHIVAYAWARGAVPPRLSQLLRRVRPPSANSGANAASAEAKPCRRDRIANGEVDLECPPH